MCICNVHYIIRIFTCMCIIICVYLGIYICMHVCVCICRMQGKMQSGKYCLHYMYMCRDKQSTYAGIINFLEP